MKIRIKFAKYGAMKFIGHLDMMRFFQKAVRRADIAVRYSEGYSPHQIMSFASPLGVGIESLGEYLDLEVVSITSAENVKQALNRAMVEGVEVLSVTVLPDQAKNAMASVAAAAYRLQMKEGRFPVADLSAKIQDFFHQDRIPCIKKTKKSEVELDLKQGLYEIGADADGAVYMLLNASSSGSIKPAMVFEAFCQFAREEIPACAYQITRLEIYADLADKEEAHRFVPLAASADAGCIPAAM